MSKYEQKRDEAISKAWAAGYESGQADRSYGAANADKRRAVKQFGTTVDNLTQQAQTNGVAWAISIIDELHIGTPGSQTTDRLMKGIKNDLRNRYEEATGIDPAPDYPVKVELRKPAEVNE